MDKYVCCKANKYKACQECGCIHRTPHKRGYDPNYQLCSKWGRCHIGNDEYIKVRCVKIKV